MSETPTQITMRLIRNEIIEECAKCIPTSWLDPLLSGPSKVAEFKDGPKVELLLLALVKRIRALTSPKGDPHV